MAGDRQGQATAPGWWPGPRARIAAPGPLQPRPVARPRTRSIVTLLIAIAAVIAALTLIGDVREVRARLGGFAWITFAAALGLALGNYALRFVRWHGYLRTRQLAVPVGQSALVFVAGFSMAVTPGKLGELIKSYLLRQLAGIRSPPRRRG